MDKYLSWWNFIDSKANISQLNDHSIFFLLFNTFTYFPYAKL